MIRFLSYATALALVLSMAATSAVAAGKKKKKQDAAGTLVGTITAVAEGGKSITIVPLGGKKKARAAGVELKITDKTRIDYVGIKDKSAQKLEVGLVVLVARDENDPATATAIAAGKVAAKGKKKKTKAGQ